MDAVSKGIIGDFLPVARVSKVTLQNEALPVFNDNPHILEGDTPTFDEAFEQQLDSRPLTVTLDLNIKDTFGDNLVSTWFANIDFKKYLHIRVYQIRSKGLHSKLKQNMNNIAEFSKYIAKAIQDGTLVPTVSRDLKTINLSYDYNNHPAIEMLKNTFKDKNWDGTTYYEFNYKVKFGVETSAPSHLSYFYMVGIDINALANDFDFEAPIEDSHFSQIKSEIVFKNGSIKDTGMIYGTKESGGTQVWKGHVIWNEDKKEYQGVSPASAAPSPPGPLGTPPDAANLIEENTPLLARQTKNKKIQDFRIRNKLFHIPIDMSFVENSIYSPLAKAASKDTLSSIKNGPPAYFSELLGTKATDEKTRLFFSFNLLGAMQNESKFSAIYNSYLSENLRKLILDYSEYNFIDIYRERVSGVDDSILDQVQIAHGYTYNNSVAFRDPVIVDGYSKPAGSQRFFKTEKDNFGVHHFELVDIKPKSDKWLHYKYRIEIEIKDGLSLFFQKMLNFLFQELEPALQKYYEMATAAGFFDYKVGKFTPEFKENPMMIQSYEIIKNNIVRLMNTIQILAAPFITKSSQNGGLEKDFEPYEKFVDRLNLLTSPNYGSPTGIGLLMEVSNQVISILESILDSKAVVDSGLSVYPPKKSPSGGPTRTIKLVKRIDNPFQEKFDRLGYDFLSLPSNEDASDVLPSSPNGLTKITKQLYEARVDKETAKYFKNIDAMIVIGNEPSPPLIFHPAAKKYSFLTPSFTKLDLAGSVFPVQGNPFQPNPYTDTFIAVIKANIYGIPPTGSPIENLAEEEEGISAEGNQEDKGANPFKFEDFDEDIIVEDLEDLEEKESSEQVSINLTMAIIKYLYDPDFIAGSYDLLSEEGIFSIAENYDNLLGDFLELPNPVKALFTSSASSDLVNYDLFEHFWLFNDIPHAAMFFYNFIYIFKIEYLAGYKESFVGPTRTFIKESEWKELTAQAFGGDDALLCRIRRYVNPKFIGSYKSQAVDLPIYNEYFFIGAPQTEGPPKENAEESPPEDGLIDPEDIDNDPPE